MQTCDGGTLKTTHKRTLFVRALFDFDPIKDSSLPGKGLSFKHGDVLHVTNAGDEEWWQARMLVGDLIEQGVGIIPSKTRIEKRELAKTKNVKFLGRESDSTGTLTNDKKKRYFFGKRFHFVRSRERSKSENMLDIEPAKGSDSALTETQILSYEPVRRVEIKYCRPVVIMGMFKDHLGDALIADHPQMFETCVPHTTRARKEDEIDGRDYHFVASREQMERDLRSSLFVEAGEYNSHLYGTSTQAIKEVAERGKHCLLDVSGGAIKRLQLAGIYPISIFIKPRSIENIMEFNQRLTVEQARIAFDKFIAVEKEFAPCFTAILIGGSPEEIYIKVKEVIQVHSKTADVWVSTNEKL